MSTQVNTVLNFIDRRFGDDYRWTSGNCLWFAHILISRFPDGKIVYDPIVGHFLVAFPDGSVIDWTGVVDTTGMKLEALEDIKCEDKLLYEHLMRDCWM